MNTSVKYGLIGGLIYIILQMAAYLINSNILFNWGGVTAFMILLIVIFAVCGYYAINTKRKGLGGFIKFKQAFIEAFITVVVISILMNVFNYVLYAFIDPSLETQLREFVIETTASMMESAPEEVYDEVVEKLEEQDFISLMGTLGGIVQMIFLGAIIGAITSAIMKKEDPEEAYNKALAEDTIDL